MKKLLIFLCFSLFFATAINAQNCQAGFNYSTNGLTATFTDSSYSSVTGGFQSSWNFGDGTFSNSMNPSHGYSQSGAYSVCLTISDSLCSNSICSTIVIQSHPPTCQADFYFIPTGLNVQFH
ncbi:MAG: PKD domain-containing protein, partial [Vicingaceae bacterium]